jgi:hypothetical protein
MNGMSQVQETRRLLVLSVNYENHGRNRIRVGVKAVRCKCNRGTFFQSQ